MSTWIEVNGSKIEKEFFDENVREAKGYDWSAFPVATLSEHVHCMICGMAFGSKSATTTLSYRAKEGYLCAYCYEHFLK